MKQKSEIIYYIFLSIIAVLLLLILIYFDASKTKNIEIYDRLIIGCFFIICCLFGISLAFYPRWYRKILKTNKINLNKKNNKKVLRKRKGHHPDCDKFKNHIIRFDTKVLCTGCLGLAVGALISIILIIIYLVVASEKTLMVNYFLIFLGLIMIAFNFIEIIFRVRYTANHMFSNIFFIVGFLFIVVGVFEITNSLPYAILSIIFTILWLHTRIQFSNRCHTIICSKCSEKCKMY